MRAIVLFLSLLALSVIPAARAEDYSFGTGAKGFFIAELNTALKMHLGRDARTPSAGNLFDTATAANVDLLCRQKKVAGHTPGRAGEQEFKALGLRWPSDICRCFQLIDQWEGTELELQGPPESEDNYPTVTFGIIGFTSHDGSLQWFLYRANKMLDGRLSEIIAERLGKDQRHTFDKLIAIGQTGLDDKADPRMIAANKAFVAWALKSPMGNPKPEIREAVHAFGSIPRFLDVQLDLCKKKAWGREAKPTYLPMLFPSVRQPSLQAKLLALEMTVLTNGPDAVQRAVLAKTLFTTEHQRMLQILDAMRHSKITMADMNDVMERESCIVNGHGKVHDDDYDLAAYALMPY
jgi:hypothetical protein